MDRVLTAKLVSNNLPLVDAYLQRQLDALGDPTRRAILERLLKHPLPVGELARELPVSRPAVSQHLRVLKDAHLVTGRTAGSRRIYALDPQGVGALRAYLDQFWQRALTAYQAAVADHQQEVS